ncbi:hypothetical protein ALON55S_02977 [Alishewanella longhuensis]
MAALKCSAAGDASRRWRPLKRCYAFADRAQSAVMPELDPVTALDSRVFFGIAASREPDAYARNAVLVVI